MASVETGSHFQRSSPLRRPIRSRKRQSLDAKTSIMMGDNNTTTQASSKIRVLLQSFNECGTYPSATHQEDDYSSLVVVDEHVRLVNMSSSCNSTAATGGGGGRLFRKKSAKTCSSAKSHVARAVSKVLQLKEPPTNVSYLRMPV